MVTIYKICPRTTWEGALQRGVLTGSPDDVRDGFLHLSTAPQLAGTIAKHFAGQRDLVLLAVDAANLGAALRWEPSRGGMLFPHLYSDLPTACVRHVWPLGLDDTGAAVLPEGLS